MPASCTRCYLRMGDASLDEAKPFDSQDLAVAEFRLVARELARYGQDLEASLYIARNREELQEYPDFMLSLGARGGVKVTRCF